VGVNLKKIGPRYTWVVFGQATCTFGQSKVCSRVHATVTSTARVYPAFLVKSKPKESIDPPSPCCVGRMYVQWREREHEAISELVAVDPNIMVVLMQCSLLKFFLCPFMHAQPRLLNAMIDYWHPDVEAFMLEGQSLVPTTEDIYFLNGLSRRGEPVNFWMFPAGPSKISEVIVEHCEARTDHVGSQVPISKITILVLQTILLLIGRITGLASLHQASRAQMNYAIQCTNAKFFDWSTTLLECMKRQLTDCRQWTQMNFRFGTILCSFFFERVPSFSPRVAVREHQASFPAVCRWAVLLPRQGFGRTVESFDDDFFAWLSRQIPVIEDYPYAEIVFSRDTEIPVPPGEERGEMGKSPPL
jgi:hypothetical protein